ncbi:methyltransferase, FkbM family [Jannaschia seosinensis]|uniref:Methyltransferase, FkbM family n=1 Tax=Jannaschia seosinensis TaxID=313367 RepID=A0A0M7BFJ8_9RHOB|nr:FkbM family methyltransferase [Jannaschia seosinensis]CUH40683.1 methyltransferase, FkbM family [Jannaschia seosinensis]
MPDFTIHGVHLTVPDRILRPRIAARLAAGAYEQFEAAAAARCITSGARVLELGAGIGFVSCICARGAGAENLVSVEANPHMRDVIRANLDANGHQAATLLHGAVGAAGAAETVTFRCAPAFWASAIADGSGRGEEVAVPVLRLADLFAAYRPNVVVMDIEGGEAALFDAPWPDHVEAVLMELHPEAYPAAMIGRIFDCLLRSGLVYAPDLSRSAVVGFRRVRE